MDKFESLGEEHLSGIRWALLSAWSEEIDKQLIPLDPKTVRPLSEDELRKIEILSDELYTQDEKIEKEVLC